MVIRETLDGFQGGLQIGGRMVTNLRYADDIILLATSEAELYMSWWPTCATAITQDRLNMSSLSIFCQRQSGFVADSNTAPHQTRYRHDSFIKFGPWRCDFGNNVGRGVAKGGS